MEIDGTISVRAVDDGFHVGIDQRLIKEIKEVAENIKGVEASFDEFLKRFDELLELLTRLPALQE
jgi:hypothetical protein